MRKKLACLLAVSALLFSAACSEEDLSDFQRNATDPDFSVFTLVEDYPSLSYIWDNMDSDLVNDRLSDTMDKHSDEFVKFSTIQSNIMRSNPEALVALVNKGGLAMDALLDEEEKYYYSPFVEVFYGDRGSKYQNDFYGLLERISNAETTGLRPAVMNIARTIVGYIIDTKDPAELNKFMNKAIGAMEDMEREDFVDLTKLLGKMLMSANYPMYLYEEGHANEGELITDPDDIDSNSVNTGLGNMTAGLVALLDGAAQMVSQDADLKDKLFSLMDEVPVLYAAKTDNGKDLPHVLVDLITNIESYFLPDDGDNTPADRSDYYITGNEYINSDLKNTIKEMLPALSKLMITSGKPGSAIKDPESKGRGFLDVFLSKLKNIGWDDEKIASMDFDNDLVNMIRYDGFARDRLDPTSGASNVSYLDHTIFTLIAAGNYGYRDRGKDFGHSRGTPNGGMISLNDCLQNQGVYATLEQDPYTMCFDKNTDGFDNSDPGNYTFRSNKVFSVDERENYKFFLKPSYPSNCLLSGQCIGDGGLPNGGRSIGTDGFSGGSNTDINYWPYNGNGTGEMNTGLWSVGWIVRTCWKGEGPYYYADPNAEQVEIDGEMYAKFMRPNGSIYAYVHKPEGSEADPAQWIYVYPNDDKGDAPIETAEFGGLGKTKNYSTFNSDGSRLGFHGSWSCIGGDEVGLIFRDSTNDEFSFSRAVYSNPNPGTMEFDCGIHVNDIVDAINGSSLAIEASTAASDIVNDGEKLYFSTISKVGPMAIINNHTDVTTNSFSSTVWENGSGSSRIGFIPAKKFYVHSDSVINIKIDNLLDKNISFTSGAILTLDEVIKDINDQLNAPVTEGEAGYVYYAVREKVQPNIDDVCTYDDADRSKFTDDTQWQNFIDNEAPALDDSFKIKGLPDTDLFNSKIEITCVNGTAIQDLFNLNLSDGQSMVVRSKGRENRYKQVWNTDYYMFEVNGVKYAPNGWSGVRESNSAGCYTITEKIPENPTAAEYASGITRECVSQEEAMYKNYQYLMGEKKIMYVIPILIDHAVIGCDIEYVVNCLVEANGIAGLSNARKYGFGYEHNGKWIKKGATGDSTIPGDGRIWADIYEITGIPIAGVTTATMFESVGNGFVLPSAVGYNMAPVERMAFMMHSTGKRDMMQDGNTDDPYDNVLEINSMDAGVDGPYYSRRSKAFPLIVAMMGTLDGLSYYDRTGEPERDYNLGGNHKKPLKLLTDALLPALGKPMFYYNNSGTAPTGCWKPRISGNSGALNNDYMRVVIDKDMNWNCSLDYFTPNYYRTLTGMLFESGPKMVDGLVPLMAKSKMGTKTIQLLNAIAHGDSAIYDDVADYDPEEMKTWGVRRKISWGLEQLMTGMKATKGEVFTLSYLNDLAESWQYATGTAGAWTNVRDCDIVMDDMLDDLIDDTLADLPDTTQAVTDERLSSMGRVIEATLDHENIATAEPITIKMDDGSGTLNAINVTVNGGLVSGSAVDGYGRFIPATGDIYFVLKDEPTGKITMSYSFNQDWQGFYDLFEDLGMFIESDSEYYIYDDVVQVMKSALDAMTYDENLATELKGTLYTLGKLFAYYNGDKWVYQGEKGFDFLFTMMKEDLPLLQRLMLDDSGDNIEAVLVLVNDLIKKEGVIDAVLDSVDAMNVTDAFEWREIFADLGALLKDPLMTEIDSDLWPTLADMMDDMSEAIVGSKGTVDENGETTSDALKEIYRDYGFQYNGI